MLLHVGTAVSKDAVHRVVVTHGVVVIEGQPTGLRSVSRLQRVLPGTVPPAALAGVLLLCVLRLSHVKVGAACELVDFAVEFAVVVVVSRKSAVGLVVGHVHHRFSCIVDSETNG